MSSTVAHRGSFSSLPFCFILLSCFVSATAIDQAHSNCSSVGIFDLLTSELQRRHSDGGFVWHKLGTNVLQESSGVLRNGELTVILGPSGSGKTSFLTALAQMSSISDGEIARFEVKGDEIVLDSFSSQQVGYLQQHDDFFNQLTVFETLQLASYLELPTQSKDAREQRIRQVVQQLGLHGALHRRIGDRSLISSPSKYKKRRSQELSDGRLSGGERRRLSVALELLTAKQILIADEPTSGLDSAYSDTVVKLLKDLAQSQNIPAVASLHQPRSSIWNRLDSVILMAPGGRICYAGDRENVVEYFGSLGYQLPPNTNPAEYLLDLVSIDSENLEKATQDEARIASFERIFKNRPIAFNEEKQIRFGVNELNEGWNMWGHRKSLIRWVPRLGALLRRSWRQNVRDTNLNVIRLAISIGNAILLSGIFPTIKAPGPLVSSIADRVALLSFSAINLIMLAYMKSVTLFARERKVVQREQTREQYSAFEYLVAKFIAEMPLDAFFSLVFSVTLKKLSGLIIPLEKLAMVFVDMTFAGASLGYLLGSIAPQQESYATTAGIPILVVLMIVGVINPSGVDLSQPPPLVVQILKKASPIALGIEALCIGEYPGVQFKQGSEGVWSRVARAPRMGGLALIRNGDQVLRALGLQTQSFIGAMRHLTTIAAGNLVLSWISLMIRRYQNRRKENGTYGPTRYRRRGVQNRDTMGQEQPMAHRKLRI